ncbi:hypothetical protein ACTGVR_01195 [Streptococcus suis]|nr:hypothetical protein [Streptococcus suis]
MTNAEEITFFKNNPLFYIFLALIILLFFLAHKLLAKVPSILLFLIGAGAFVIFSAYMVPNVDGLLRADPHYLFKAAIQMNMGDYSSFDKISSANYMSTFPTQMGLLSLFRLYAHFTTNTSYLFFAQVAMVIVCNFLLWRTSNLLFKKQELNNLVILISFLFLPNFFLIFWVYGDIPGLLCLLFALYFYIQFNQTNHILFGIGLLFFISLACFVRNNYQIFLVVLFILQGLSFLREFNYKKLIILLLLFPTVKLPNVVVQHYYEEKIQQSITYPPQAAWVVMGLSDNAANNGYFNTYTTLIRVWNDYDDQRVEEVVKKDLKSRIDAFTASPTYAKEFFREKIAVTWNEPTLQSIYAGPLYTREQYTHTVFLKNLYQEGSYYHIYNKYMSVFLTSIYLLSFFYLFLKFIIFREKFELVQLYPFLYLIGGFIFHLFWETKSRYVWPYIYLLLPVVAVNINYISQKLKWKSRNKA